MVNTDATTHAKGGGGGGICPTAYWCPVPNINDIPFLSGLPQGRRCTRGTNSRMGLSSLKKWDPEKGSPFLTSYCTVDQLEEVPGGVHVGRMLTVFWNRL